LDGSRTSFFSGMTHLSFTGGRIRTNNLYIHHVIVYDYAASSMGLHSHFLGELRNHYCEVEYMAVQGHRRSLISVPIESAYTTSY